MEAGLLLRNHMGKRVLVVDDHVPVVRLIEERLRHEGFDVLAAHNGADCLRAVAAQRPDLVILDLEMPIMDGLRTLRALRLKPGTGLLPVIILTVHKEKPDLIAGWMAGADEYLTKPCRMDDLVAAVKRVLAAPPGRDAVLPAEGPVEAPAEPALPRK